MNPAETRSLMQLIQGIRGRHVTVLLIEHHMRVVMGISDRIAVLVYGQKIAEGAPEEFRNHPRVIEAYLGQEQIDCTGCGPPSGSRARAAIAAPTRVRASTTSATSIRPLVGDESIHLYEIIRQRYQRGSTKRLVFGAVAGGSEITYISGAAGNNSGREENPWLSSSKRVPKRSWLSSPS